MDGSRKGEQGNPPTRQQRFYKLNDYWYFDTREGTSIGPFDNLEQARRGARDYVTQVKSEPATADIIRRYVESTSR